MTSLAGIQAHSESRSPSATPRGLIPAIGFLVILQATLAQFVVHGVPLFLREAGHSATVIGLIYLVSLPYVMRFLWAPLIDRYGSARLGHFRSWIVAGLAVACCALTAASFLDPARALPALLATIFFLMIGVATQITATGGLMVEGLAEADRPKGAAILAASAGLAGLLLGAGVLFWMAELGWSITIAGVTAIAAIGLVAVFFLPLDSGTRPGAKRAPFWSQFSILRRADTRNLLGVSILVSMGLVLTYGLKSIVLIDAGYSISEAGIVGLVIGNAIGVCFALMSRPLVERWGGFPCLAAIGLLAALYCLVFAVLFADGVTRGSAAAFVIIANGLTFASYAASRTLIMARCAEGRKATELATFISLEGIALLLLAGLGNLLSDLAGMPVVLLLAAAGSFAGAVLARRAASKERKEMVS